MKVISEEIRGTITVIYGDRPKEMTLRLLEEVCLEKRIAGSAKVGIKPNLVNSTPPEHGATTHVEIVEGIVEYLQNAGISDITVLEGSWIGGSTKDAFHKLGYEKLAKERNIRLVDTKTDRFEKRSFNGIDIEISKTALNLDFLIDVPVLKGHCQTLVTGAMKNLKGIISDGEKRRFHSLGLHKPIAYLNRIISADFCVVDGICGDLDFEDGGNPVPMNRIFCCEDPVLTDAYIAQTMGYDPRSIEYIALAEDIGVGSTDLKNNVTIELNRDDSRVKPFPSGIAAELSKYINESDACSACYANLMQALMRLKDNGELKRFPKNSICIGQGFRGKSLTDPGIGNCCNSFQSNVKGCPAKAVDILEYLRRREN